MDYETTSLVDEIIRYARHREMPIEQAGRQLVELAKQRLPEYRLESQRRSGEIELCIEVEKSDKCEIVMRVPIRSWIHQIVWLYYPGYHVIGKPYESYAIPVHCDIETWPDVSDPKTVYLDDIFFDPNWECFWQPEPYLGSLPVSARAYEHRTSKKLEELRGTPFFKVSPEIMSELMQARSDLPSYTVKPSDPPPSWRSPTQGSKGWKDRMAVINLYGRQRSKKVWGSFKFK
jgi:hypothetical protein